MKCPVNGCEFELFRQWEANIPSRRNFTGVFACPRHGVMKASGVFDPVSHRKDILYFNLACPEHGTDSVVVDARHGIHTCMVCHRSWTADAEGKHIHRGPLPDPGDQGPVTWMNTVYAAGLDDFDFEADEPRPAFGDDFTDEERKL